jgi:6-phosphofructokinase 2
MAGAITLTMNPALDLSTRVDAVVPFRKLRCEAARRDPGGGGINVARVIARLGGDAAAIFPAGGPTGQMLRELVAAQGVAARVVPIAGDTREDFTVFERGSGRQFRFVAPGPSLSGAETRDCLAVFDAACRGAAYAVISGSLPPGVPDAFLVQAAQAAGAQGARIVIDSSGPALEAALAAGVFLIKPNRHEFAKLAGLTAPDLPAMAAAGRAMIAAGKVEAIALSLAEQGAMLMASDLCLIARAPKIEAVSTVGAGDSFLAAMIARLMAGADWREALRWAVAAGSAALLSPGTDLAHADAVGKLLPEVAVEQMA